MSLKITTLSSIMPSGTVLYILIKGNCLLNSCNSTRLSKEIDPQPAIVIIINMRINMKVDIIQAINIINIIIIMKKEKIICIVIEDILEELQQVNNFLEAEKVNLE